MNIHVLCDSEQMEAGGFAEQIRIHLAMIGRRFESRGVGVYCVDVEHQVPNVAHGDIAIFVLTPRFMADSVRGKWPHVERDLRANLIHGIPLRAVPCTLKGTDLVRRRPLPCDWRDEGPCTWLSQRIELRDQDLTRLAQAVHDIVRRRFPN